jgi:zinc/manganese transport system substrate-binding protein
MLPRLQRSANPKIGIPVLPVRARAARALAFAAMLAATALLAAACSVISVSDTADADHRRIIAVGAENQYANVISQLGGKYVSVTAIESNPNTDPHDFEGSASVSEVISAAQLVVQNGLGYDSYMNKIEAAAPNAKRRVIDVQTLLGLPDSTPNPHLWYSPTTMPAVAKALAADLSALQPAHAGYFRANLARFDASLRPWLQAIAAFKARYSGTPVATTEPVGDYMLQAAGTDNLTPFGLQADIMNGVDLPAQYVSLQDNLLRNHRVRVRVFVYNQQVVDTVTQSFLSTARQDGTPVVGVYETMPTPGYSYQSWMLAEVQALQKAVADKVSTEKL